MFQDFPVKSEVCQFILFKTSTYFLTAIYIAGKKNI